MCGIISLSRCFGKRICSDRVKEGLAAIAHRGPDDTNVWTSVEGDVVLGHKRLSVIGLENGCQPVTTTDGHICAVVNGEFYGFEELRASLIARGATFTTDSDSEIIIHLYRLFGLPGIQLLRGEFAFILFDCEQRTIVAARDRLGIKPLFYGTHQDTLYIGSEVKALIAAGFPAKWDVDSYIARQFYLSDQTLFLGIQSVKPGHILIGRGAHTFQYPYWQLKFPDRTTQRASYNDEEVSLELRHEILESIRLRLRSDVPVAVYLSGGIDSSAMLGAATHLHGAPLQAFHVSFGEGSGYDESVYAQEAAAHSRADLTCLPVSQDDLADNFEEALWHNEVPFFNAHGVAKFLLSRTLRDAGFKVVITGEGADEIFGGYPHFRRDMVLYNSENQDAGIVSALKTKIMAAEPAAKCGAGREPSLLRERFGHGVSWVDNQSAWAADLVPLFAQDIRNQYSDVKPFLMAYEELFAAGFNSMEPVHRSMLLWARTFLPNFVLTTLGDRMEMAHSIEGRVPLLDHIVVERAASLPVHLKIRGSVEKFIFREAMKPFIPASLYKRRKHYFRTPPATLEPEGKLHQLVLDTISSNLIEALPFFDPRQVRRFASEISRRTKEDAVRLDPILMEITSLCLLQKRYALAV